MTTHHTALLAISLSLAVYIYIYIYKYIYIIYIYIYIYTSSTAGHRTPLQRLSLHTSSAYKNRHPPLAPSLPL